MHFPGPEATRVRTVYSMVEDADGALWLGTTLGVWQHDRERDELVRPASLASAPGPVRSQMNSEAPAS